MRNSTGTCLGERETVQHPGRRDLFVFSRGRDLGSETEHLNVIRKICAEEKYLVWEPSDLDPKLYKSSDRHGFYPIIWTSPLVTTPMRPKLKS